MQIWDESGAYLLDEASGDVYDEYGAPLAIMDASECNVYAGLTVEVQIETNVGAPYQGDIRNLATDRWYSMYPS